MKRPLLLCVALLMGTTAAFAEDAPPPMVIPHGTKDIGKTVPGDYTLDVNHVGVLARVSHLGFSMSLFRFEKATATLQWDPKAVGASKLNATVETASITSNVPGFAADICEKYLLCKDFPQATFVSTAFHQKDATHGTVDGIFTLKGKSVKLSFAVSLVGAGPGFAGGPTMGHVIGIHAEGWIKPQDFSMGPFFTDPIEIVIDTEFDHPE
ncbi:MAG: YceI family protein [Proteobacteria bacterium]|nr:YceI family protein [Pseudomonadota bacterium]